tara:strand:+ start:885 stop:1106 length:222 start_codon:yes stop_codon:yes gene_type:complete
MKVGDLVKRADKPNYNYGVGLIVKQLETNPFLIHPDDPDALRWAVLWTNPVYTMEDGTSVQYEAELEVIGEAR